MLGHDASHDSDLELASEYISDPPPQAISQGTDYELTFKKDQGIMEYLPRSCLAPAANLFSNPTKNLQSEIKNLKSSSLPDLLIQYSHGHPERQ